MSTQLSDLANNDLSGFKISKVTSVYYKSEERFDPDIRIAVFTEKIVAEEFVEKTSSFFLKEELTLTNGKRMFFFESTHAIEPCATAQEAEDKYQKYTNVY